MLTVISPSANRITSTFDNGIPALLAIFSASGLLAESVNNLAFFSSIVIVSKPPFSNFHYIINYVLIKHLSEKNNHLRELLLFSIIKKYCRRQYLRLMLFCEY